VPVPARCDPSELLALALAGVRVHSLEVVQAGFEDAFAWRVRRLAV
jgi:hypothetical protein